MIIPVSPVTVRIALETQSINNNGYVVHDIDVAELIEKADSVQYELQLCYATSSLYRSSVYHINKYARSITFFFMVGLDMYTGTMAVGTTRFSFAKVQTGLSEGEVQNAITNRLEAAATAGFSQNLTDVDDTDGCTITMPFADVSIIAAGHLVIYERGSAYSTSNVYETDFFHTPGTNEWRYKTSSGDFSLTLLTSDAVKTGIHITNVDAHNFDVFVTWYYNPDGCYLEEGSFTPGV
jgi:hypothetical protein